MNFIDKNQTLEPPEGYVFTKSEACGAYLVLLYTRLIYDLAQQRNTGQQSIQIYLNDMGREVARTEDAITFAPSQPAFIMPDTFRFHFWHGWYSIWGGVKEIIRCHKSASVRKLNGLAKVVEHRLSGK